MAGAGIFASSVRTRDRYIGIVATVLLIGIEGHHAGRSNNRLRNRLPLTAPQLFELQL